MGRDVMDDRKRALVMGKFKFLYQDDCEDLEGRDQFQLAIMQNKLLGPVNYFDKNGKDADVLLIYGKERPSGEGFSDPDVKIPGVLDFFTVVWSNPFGELFVDQDIKLFEFSDIQKYSTYNEGPKSQEFCQFYSSSKSKELDGFDCSIFWSAGLLWKHFKTCGVEKWDLEFKELITHYRNWRDWAHEVHNKPDKAKKKFSDNPYSGPATTSTNYSRKLKISPTKPAIDRSNNNESPRKGSNPVYARYNPSVAPPGVAPKAPAPVLAAPPVGQAITVPVPGPGGTTVQSSWTSAVDEFLLSKPRSVGDGFNNRDLSPEVPRIKSPVTARKLKIIGKVKTGQKRKVTVLENKISDAVDSEKELEIDVSELKPKKKRFKPRSKVTAPSPDGKNEANELDTCPEPKHYVGTILDWKGKFGFITCADISGKVFVHSKDIKEGKMNIKVGAEAKFQVLYQDCSQVGAKAVNVRIL